MSKPTDFAANLNKYFNFYLPGRNLSTNTMRSYADTFSLFLEFCEQKLDLKPEILTLEKVTMETVEAFLRWTKDERQNSPSTRRQRLAAIHSFFRFMQISNPPKMFEYQRILAIKLPKIPKHQPTHIPYDAMKEFLSSPDTNTSQGLRDCALLCLLYDTGARVQELIDLSVRDIRLNAPATVTLTGKGRKTRTVPIIGATVQILDRYVTENHLTDNGKSEYPLFFNRQNNRLTRAGISYIIRKYLQKVNTDLIPDKISPHIFRHTKAMHLLQSGIDIILIKDILGHSDVSTTEVYARADTEMKRQALQRRYQESVSLIPSWHTNGELRSWLKGLSTGKQFM